MDGILEDTKLALDWKCFMIGSGATSKSSARPPKGITKVVNKTHGFREGKWSLGGRGEATEIIIVDDLGESTLDGSNTHPPGIQGLGAVWESYLANVVSSLISSGLDDRPADIPQKAY